MFNHDPTAMLHFDVEWEHRLPWHDILDAAGVASDITPELALEATIGRADGPAERIEVKDFAFRFERPDLQWAEPEPPIRLGMRKVREEGYELIAAPPRALRRDVQPLSAPVHFYGFPYEVQLLYRNAHFVDDLSYELEQQLEATEYLGPLRQKPWRTYSWSGEAPQGVGSAGERTVPALLAAQERSISSGGQGTRPFLEVIARHLLHMGLLESCLRAGLCPRA